MLKVIQNILGSKKERDVRKLILLVETINREFDKLKLLSEGRFDLKPVFCALTLTIFID